MIGSQLKSRFRGDVPREVIKAIAEGIIERYALSADEAELRWLGAEATDALASMRRADIETGLVALRGRFPGLVEVEVAWNATENARHREVYVAGWVITQSKIENRQGPIRKAEFRESLAFGSQTTLDSLIDPMDTIEPITGRPWGCVTHVPVERTQETPAILQVTFPMPNGRWEDSIDLYLEIPELRTYINSDYVVQLRADRKRAMGL